LGKVPMGDESTKSGGTCNHFLQISQSALIVESCVEEGARG
jgi:hypothetical protein